MIDILMKKLMKFLILIKVILKIKKIIMKQRRVVVTGMGALSPIGNNLNDFWANLINGVGGVGPITKFDSEKFKTHFACEVKNSFYRKD